nr:hypothetical protein [Tanacetum cinerariifolium]
MSVWEGAESFHLQAEETKLEYSRWIPTDSFWPLATYVGFKTCSTSLEDLTSILSKDQYPCEAGEAAKLLGYTDEAVLDCALTYTPSNLVLGKNKVVWCAGVERDLGFYLLMFTKKHIILVWNWGNIKSLAGDNQIIIVRGNCSRNGKRVSAFRDHSESSYKFLVAGGDDGHIRMHFVPLWDAVDATIKVKFGMGSNRRVYEEILTYYGDFDYGDDNLGQTINLNSAVYGHESNKDENNKKKNENKKNAKKRKRKPGGGIGNETAKCWKYFDLKMEQPDGPDRSWIKMAHCMYDDGKHFHIRCMARILNLVVKAGLKVQKKEVETIECRTRWNSTYDTLKSAIDLQEAFYNYSMNNASFFRNLKAIPRRTDFDVCQKFCDFLEKFKDKTELVSTQSGPIAHLFLVKYLSAFRSNHEIGNAWLRVRHLMENDCIPEENEDEENTPIAFLTDSENEDNIKDLVYEVETKMGVLFALYNEKYGTKSSGVDDELKKYLKEPPLDLDGILSIQISTVASESAFSMSGRVLDPYRNALSPQIVEALICTQSWVCTLQKSIYMDDLEDLLKDEDVIKEMQEALDKLKGDNGNGKGILLD